MGPARRGSRGAAGAHPRPLPGGAAAARLRPVSREWHDMTALALGQGIAAGDIDPVALAKHFLARIEALDSERTVYLHVTADRARAEAEVARRRARDGLRLGPLDGVPISWKDLFDSAGAPTTAATPLFAQRVPDTDALLLARATRAGMVCLGKTNLTEFAFSALGINPHFGTPANAYDGARRPRPRRLVVGRGGLGGARPRGGGDGQRHRRIGARAGGVEWPGRPQDHRRAAAARRRHPARRQPGHRRPAYPAT